MADFSGSLTAAARAPARARAPLPRALRIAAGLVLLVLAPWGACAIAFQAPGGPLLRGALLLVWAVGAVAALVALLAMRQGKPARVALLAAVLGIAVLLGWWQSLAPSNARDWADDVTRLATGQVNGSVLTLDHVRNFEWHADGGYTPRWEQRRYDLERLVSLDLVLSHWARPSIAHVLLSFGFDDGRQLAISLEIRREADEDFSRLGGFFKAYEAAVVAADERDIVRVRTNLRNEDAYLYRVALTAAQRRALLMGYVDEANRLAHTPRWYHTLTANCTTIALPVVRYFVPDLPLDHRLLLSGYLPDYLYEAGGLDRRLPFDELRQRARITERARAAGNSADFSQAIRRGIAPVAEPRLP